MVMINNVSKVVFPEDNSNPNSELISLKKAVTVIVTTADVSAVVPNARWKPDYKDIYKKIR